MPEWVDRAEELAKGNVAHLRESRGGDVDRTAVITCCERLKTLYSDDRWPVVNHPPQIAHEGTGFWDETIGWLHTQLPPDQLRDLYEEGIRRAAESRPSRYIFPDGIWAKLSEKARDDIITADSTWMADGLENRLATILNPVQRAIEAAQVIEELIQLTREMREASAREEKLRLNEDELAFYDALETNDSAVQVLGDETRRAIAQELVATVRANVTIDWTLRENVRAQLRLLVRRIPRRHGYPPDKREKATLTVLEQAEVLSNGWALQTIR